MTWFMIDIEADGPIPGDYSMIQIGAVVVDKQGKFNKTFYAELQPISEKYQKKALDIVGVTRETTMTYNKPFSVMQGFKQWIITENNSYKPMFISDNNGFDWMFITWYFHHFLQENPFGHSSTNLGSLYKGMVKNMFKNFKHLRKTEHTHHPVDDVKGNAEALYYIIREMELKINL